MIKIRLRYTTIDTNRQSRQIEKEKNGDKIKII